MQAFNGRAHDSLTPYLRRDVRGVHPSPSHYQSYLKSALAYQSTETGEDEIFVQPFPPTGAKYQLPNVLDNHHPLWSPDGRELFYVPGPGEFTVVGVTTQPSFSFGNPVSLNLFQSELRTGPPNQRRRHDIMPDGSGFLGVGRGDVANVNRIHIVQNWFEELRRLVPTD